MNIQVAISTTHDGDMALGNQSNPKAIDNRIRFLNNYDLKIQDTTAVRITYDGNNYRRYYEVTSSQKGDGMTGINPMEADALITRQPGHALFVTLADCVGAAIFDPVQEVLMLSHIGRHAAQQNGGQTSIDFLINSYDCKPQDLKVWLTPAPGPATFPIFAMNNRGLKELVFEQLKSAGILTENIVDNPSDTTIDKNYFSHSEFLKGNRNIDGRYALVAVMNPTANSKTSDR